MDFFGGGNFAPADTYLTASYVPGSADTSKIITLVLTSANYGNCLAVSDTILLEFTTPPYVNAWLDVTVCANNKDVTLNGTVSGSSSSGVWSSSGTGDFIPDSITLNGTYMPSDSDTAIGIVTLVLASTNACLITDTMVAVITPAPKVFAGVDQYICKGDTDAVLNGTVIAGSSTGQWATLGSGYFSPDDSTLNASYLLSPADTLAGTVFLVLESTNNGLCLAERDTMIIKLTTVPTVFAGKDTISCANIVLQLDGSVTGGSGTGIWTTLGSGTFSPADTTFDTTLNALYAFSVFDTTLRQVDLVLTATFACIPVDDTLHVDIAPAPVVLATVVGGACANKDTVNLIGTVMNAGGGIWSSSGSGVFIPSDTSLTAVYLLSDSDKTTNYLDIILTSAMNGICNAETDTIHLTLLPIPVVDAGPDQNICLDVKYVYLNGTISGITSTGQWTSTGSGSFPNSSNLNAIYIPSMTDTANGNAYLVLTSTNNGNCIPVSDSLLVKWTERPDVDAGIDTFICSVVDSIQLNGSVIGGTTTGLWTMTGSGLFLPADTALNAFYYPSQQDDTNGTVTFTLTATNGCAGEPDQTVLTINATPEAKFVSAEQCNNLNVPFTDQSSVFSGSITGWDWDFGDATPAGIVKNPTHTYSVTGDYNIWLAVTTDKGCTDSISASVSLHAINADFDVNGICKYETFTFTDNSTTGNDNIVSWAWNFGDGNSDNVQNTSHLYDTNNTYTAILTVQAASGCSDTAKRTVNVRPVPVAGFTSSNMEPIQYNPITLTNTSTGSTSWLWYYGDGDSTFEQSPVHSYSIYDSARVKLIAFNTYGCSDTIDMKLTIIGRFMPQVPTAFSPNGNGENDILYVKGGPFKEFDMKVYNQWGEMVFSSTLQKDGWDGTKKGVAQPVGVYAVIINGILENGKDEFHYVGDVTMVR